jgi:hypothetical protein
MRQDSAHQPYRTHQRKLECALPRGIIMFFKPSGWRSSRIEHEPIDPPERQARLGNPSSYRFSTGNIEPAGVNSTTAMPAQPLRCRAELRLCATTDGNSCPRLHQSFSHPETEPFTGSGH